MIDNVLRWVDRFLRPDLARFRSGKRRLEVVHPDEVAERERIERNNPLISHAKSITSQVGEDGVIAHILDRLEIAGGWCVEFGAWDGKFNANTWDLVHNRGWKAVYSPSTPSACRADPELSQRSTTSRGMCAASTPIANSQTRVSGE